MSNPSTVILQLAAANSSGIALAQAVAAAGNLTLNGALVTAGVATFDVARRVLIASTGNSSAVVFTITGTDRSGNAQTDTITGLGGAAGASAYSTRDFLTVSKIAASAACTGNISAGTNGVGSSPWVVDNFFASSWALGGGISGPAGTTYSLEHTYDDPNDTGTSLTVMPQQFAMNPASYVPAHVFTNSVINNVSGDNEFDYPDHPIYAHRLTIMSGNGQVVMQSIQNGITS